MSKKFLSVGNQHGSSSSFRSMPRKSEKQCNETDNSQKNKANKQLNRFKVKDKQNKYFLNRGDQELRERAKKRLDCSSTEVTVTTDFHDFDKKTVGHKSLKAENGLPVSCSERESQLLPGHEKKAGESCTTESQRNSSRSPSDTTVSDDVKQEAGSQEDSFLELDAKLFNSQDGQSQCDVLWDCRSPEIMKQLKKLRGKHRVEDVKEIVSYFPDDADVQVEPTSHFRPVRIWQGPQTVMGSNRNFGGVLKRGHRKQKKSRNRKVVQEMLDFLHSLAKKDQPGQSSEQTGQGVVEISTSSGAESKLEETVSASASSSRLVDNDDEGLWSDEDLFKDNSFLIEATQNPEKFFHKLENNKQLSISAASCSAQGCEAGPSVKSCGNAPVTSMNTGKAVHSVQGTSSGSKPEHGISSTGCLSDSSCDDSMIIPSSLAKPVQPKANVFCQAFKGPPVKNSFPAKKTVQNSYSSHVSSYGTKFSDSVKSFAARQTNNSVRNQHQNACGTQQNATASGQQTNKSVWKKHNSLQPQSSTNNGIPSAIKYQSRSSTSSTSVTVSVTSRINGSSASTTVKDGSNPGSNSSFRKSLSFDSFQSPSPKGADSKDNSGQREGKREQEFSFDTSLPDEVLLLLAEPDEILDSQEVIAASQKPCQTSTKVIPTRNASNQYIEKKSSCNTGSIGSLKSMGQKAYTSSGADTFRKDSSGETKKHEMKNGLFSPIKAVDSLHSSVISSPVQTFFKRTFGLKSKEGGAFGPKASTPVKCPRKEDEKDPIVAGGFTETSGNSSDSFLESVFDDSFMNDGHLFESQILPLLEQAESQLETATRNRLLTESKVQPLCRTHEVKDVRMSTKSVSMHQPGKAATTMAAQSNKATTATSAQPNKTAFKFIPSKKPGTMTVQPKQGAITVPQPNKCAPDISRCSQSHFTASSARLNSNSKSVSVAHKFSSAHSNIQSDTGSAVSGNTSTSGPRMPTKHYPPKTEREQHASIQVHGSRQVKQPGCSPFQCSPEEIALKRQAAIERRSLRVSQSGKT